MLTSISFRVDKDRVCVFSGDKLLAELSAGEAVELGFALKACASAGRDGWHYNEGRLRVGTAKDRAVVLVAGKAILNAPQDMALKIGGAARQAGKIAEHWEILNQTPTREKLYADQAALIKGTGIRNINLGVPNPELKQMGGVPSKQGIGRPSVIGRDGNGSRNN